MRTVEVTLPGLRELDAAEMARVEGGQSQEQLILLLLFFIITQLNQPEPAPPPSCTPTRVRSSTCPASTPFLITTPDCQQFCST